MSFVLVQKEHVAPSADQLKRAFKLVKGLTEADATKLANDAYGVLIKNLAQPDALKLQAALASEGVATEVVETARFPKLVDAKFIKRAEMKPDALALLDPIGRPLAVPWEHIVLIAAGCVGHFGVSSTTKEERVLAYDPLYGVHTEVVTETRHKVERDAQWLVDMFLAGGAMRFQVEAESFLFKFTFDRPELDLAGKVALLVQLLAQHAPRAVLNRGAAALCASPARAFSYAGKNYLFEESQWLLWRMMQVAGE